MNQENAESPSPELKSGRVGCEVLQWLFSKLLVHGMECLAEGRGFLFPMSPSAAWGRDNSCRDWSPNRLSRIPQAPATQQQVKRLNMNPVCVSGLWKLSSSGSSPCWEQEHSPFEQGSCFPFRTALKEETPSLSFPHNSQVLRMLAL